MKTYLYRASNLKSTINFWHPPITFISCDLFIIIITRETHEQSTEREKDQYKMTERERCQPHNRTIQAKRKRTTEREM